MVTRPLDAVSSEVPLIILIDAPTRRRVINCDRERMAAASRSPDSFPPRVGNTIEQHGLTLRSHRERRAGDAQQTVPAGWCMSR